MSTGLLTAGSGQGWENELVAALDRPGSPMTVLRRCVDIGDVLAIATTGQAAVAIVSADLRRLDTEAVTRLRASGVAVVGVHPAADQRARARLERIGITALVPDDAGTDAGAGGRRATAVTDLADLARAGPRAVRSAGRAAAARRRSVDVEELDGPAPRGRVVAVWGPTGAPGRTTVATGLAVEIGAARAADAADRRRRLRRGRRHRRSGCWTSHPGWPGPAGWRPTAGWTWASLTSLCWSLGDDLRLLTGIARADRWPEVRPSAIPGVLGVAREMAPLTVVDCGFAIEADEEITLRHHGAAPQRRHPGSAGRGRCGARRRLLRPGRPGAADPRPGRTRPTRVPEAAPAGGAEPLPAVGGIHRRGGGGAVDRFAGVKVVARLPEDRAATDRAWRRGVSLAEAAPRSPLRAAIRELAGSLLPAADRGRR